MDKPTATLAAHRFGLGEARLEGLAADPQGWLLQQIGPAEAQRGEALPSGLEAVKHYATFVREQARARRAAPPMDAAMAAPMEGGKPTGNAELAFANHFRDITAKDVRARLVTAAMSPRPYAERLALFWANHFTVSMAKASARGVVGAFEREAIRPHTAGRFEALLNAAVRHPGMLRYLDNDQSAGPQSAMVRRAQRRNRDGDRPPRVSGLNENLAREVLELHTLGVGGGYTQNDVTSFARVLTGWRVDLGAALLLNEAGTRFDPAWHEPGDKTVLGRRYPEGPEALGLVLKDLAAHPSTARFVCSKLARHVVADEPPAALVDSLVARWRSSDGDLAEVSRALVRAPLAWQGAGAKLKTPEEFVVSSARLLGLGERAFERPPDGGISVLGQRVQAAPSPAGWPDRAEEWLGPDAVWKRVEWATRVGAQLGRQVDARSLAAASFGPALSDGTRLQIERAADGPQALALLLLAPEFQRR